jgi:hypothetical protein
MTAVEEDRILLRNQCRICGAGDEEAAERPVLTVAQVFQLVEASDMIKAQVRGTP